MQTTRHATIALPLDRGRGEDLGRVERALRGLPGVERVHLVPPTEMAYVVYDPARCDADDLHLAAAGGARGGPTIADTAAKSAPAADDIPRGARRWWAVLAIACAAVGAVLLFVGSLGARFGHVLPYLLLLACPLLHVAGHRGHGHGRPRRGGSDA